MNKVKMDSKSHTVIQRLSHELDKVKPPTRTTIKSIKESQKKSSAKIKKMNKRESTKPESHRSSDDDELIQVDINVRSKRIHKAPVKKLKPPKKIVASRFFDVEAEEGEESDYVPDKKVSQKQRGK